MGLQDNVTIEFQAKLSPPITYQAYSPLGGVDWDPSARSVPSIPVVSRAGFSVRDVGRLGCKRWKTAERAFCGSIDAENCARYLEKRWWISRDYFLDEILHSDEISLHFETSPQYSVTVYPNKVVW